MTKWSGPRKFVDEFPEHTALIEAFEAREAALAALVAQWREAARLSLPMIESDADEGYRAALLDCASQIERLVLAAREGEG